MNGRTLVLLAALCVCADVVRAQAPPPTASSSSVAAHPVAKPGLAQSKAVQRGKVSWYGPGFAGHKTASGERFDPRALTMAHRSLPLGTIVDVTNEANGKQVRVRVNDRGPYRHGRVADLSRAASTRLGFLDKGVTDATLRVVSLPADAPQTLASDASQAHVADPPG